MLRVRAPRSEEAPAVHAVIRASDIAAIGRPDHTLQDVRNDWESPECDVDRDVFVVEDDDGAIVGWANVDAGGARVGVHPDHEGRGVGTLLRTAAEARLRECGFPLRQVLFSACADGVEHLRTAGYERVQIFHRLRADLDAVPPPLAARVRRFDLDAEGEAIHALIEAAFTEIAFNVPQSYAAWRAEQVAGSVPAFRLAIDDDEGLAGAAVGYRWEGGVGFVAPARGGGPRSPARARAGAAARALRGVSRRRPDRARRSRSRARTPRRAASTPPPG